MMRKNKGLHILFLAAVVILAIGLERGFYAVAANRYLYYKMFRLAVFVLTRELNKSLVLLLFVSVFIMLAIKFTGARINSQVKTGRGPYGFFVFTFCSLFFAYLGWTANHHWLPKWNSFWSLAADFMILLLTVFLWRLLLRIERNPAFRSVSAGLIRKTAYLFFIVIAILNLSIFLNYKINAPQGPNVILISIDTLRADHLGCNGYGLNTSPYIDKFSGESIRFKNAFSQAPHTTPSHLSLLTSLYPGVFKVWGFPDPNALGDKYLTLAEILRNYGYATAAFTGGGAVSRRHGFNQGFEVYSDNGGIISRIFNQYAVNWIKKQKGRFFVFLHCYEPHSPYNPPAPFNEEFFKRDNSGSGLSRFIHDFGGQNQLSRVLEAWYWQSHDQDFIKNLIGLYDGEIKYVDSQINTFFDQLRAMGVFENSIIILLSDHGEAFGEHHSFTHGGTLYDEALHVPLIIHLPGALRQHNKGSIDEQVGLIDVAPTVLEICGISYPHRFQGASFAELLKNNKGFARGCVFSEIGHADQSFHSLSVRTLTHKYIVTDEPQSREELYDLLDDPGETDNILGSKYDDPEVKQVYSQFKVILDEQLRKNGFYIEEFAQGVQNDIFIKYDKEAIRRFKALGYMQ